MAYHTPDGRTMAEIMSKSSPPKAETQDPVNRALAINVVTEIINKAHGPHADPIKSRHQAIEVINALNEKGLLR